MRLLRRSLPAVGAAATAAADRVPLNITSTTVERRRYRQQLQRDGRCDRRPGHTDFQRHRRRPASPASRSAPQASSAARRRARGNRELHGVGHRFGRRRRHRHAGAYDRHRRAARDRDGALARYVRRRRLRRSRSWRPAARRPMRSTSVRATYRTASRSSAARRSRADGGAWGPFPGLHDRGRDSSSPPLTDTRQFTVGVELDITTTALARRGWRRAVQCDIACRTAASPPLTWTRTAGTTARRALGTATQTGIISGTPNPVCATATSVMSRSRSPTPTRHAAIDTQAGLGLTVKPVDLVITTRCAADGIVGVRLQRIR